MGLLCCSHTDSVEYVRDIYDFLYVLIKDKEFFEYQLQIIKTDKIIDTELQEKKNNCLIFIIKKYNEYENHLKANMQFYSNVDLIEMKIQYKILTKNIHILKQDFLEKSFDEFDNFILIER